jgi:hypothetical protein
MSKTGRILWIAMFFLLLMGRASDAAGRTCMECHGQKSIADKGSHLYLDPAKFSLTTHARIGCTTCHEKVTKRHPDDGIRPSRASCKDCHAPVFQEYNSSVHGKNALCVDCHNPHAVKPLLSVSGRDINLQCAKCHEHSLTVKNHAKWLPQASLHLDALPCITCHTGSQNYFITLYIAKKEKAVESDSASIANLSDLKPLLPAGKKVGDLIDINGDNLVSLKELRRFNTAGQYKDYTLLGTMMPETVTHGYQILNNRWDCTFCHTSGQQALQTSYLAFPQEGGTYARIAVEKGAILDILYGTPDFYMLGTTRNTTLSIIGAFIAACGLMVPIVHGTIRLMTRTRRKEQ